MENGDILLHVDGLGASYSRMRVLADVSFDLRRGECLAILGANGAGKTSLLRALSGVVVRRHGKIAFQSRTIEALPAHKIVALGLAHVPEGRHLFPPLSVNLNLEAGALPLRRRGRSGEIKELFDFVYQLFPVLSERRDQIVGTMSGGEQQMLTVARALMSRPLLLLLDEPTVGLAPKIVDELFGVLSSLKASGLSIILAEQNLGLALSLADRALVLKLGRVVLGGTSAELRDDPRVQDAYLGDLIETGRRS